MTPQSGTSSSAPGPRDGLAAPSRLWAFQGSQREAHVNPPGERPRPRVTLHVDEAAPAFGAAAAEFSAKPLFCRRAPRCDGPFQAFHPPASLFSCTTQGNLSGIKTQENMVYFLSLQLFFFFQKSFLIGLKKDAKQNAVCFRSS